MALELYILPPLFSLPSLSGSCIAALSLCQLTLAKSAFKVIESTDISIGMPAVKDGEVWIRGYICIKNYLMIRNDIDAALSPVDRADAAAWTSLIEDLGETLAVHLFLMC
jgi:Outer mitochondrial membrane transport complex protein